MNFDDLKNKLTSCKSQLNLSQSKKEVVSGKVVNRKKCLKKVFSDKLF